MKLGRRAFIQFVAGAVGGSLFTPMPWKLADDTAIWSQNWSWRPSPERGEGTTVATICLLCGGGCGIKAHLVNEHRVISISGNADHPVNAGGICPLGASGLQFLYAPYRIKQPLKQTVRRGDPAGFKPISWDEALETLSIQMAKLRDDGKPQALACLTGPNTSSMYALWQQFMTAFGSPNLFTMPSATDSHKLAARLGLGRDMALAFALEQASYVLSFGADLAEGWGTPGRAQAWFGQMRQETPGVATTKLVQLEPRCSMTAAKADEWIALKPGTEPAVALGIAHVLIQKQLYDADFVHNHAFGFEAWRDDKGTMRQGFKDLVLADYAPEQVAALSGVDTAKINQLAQDLAAQKNALVVWGSAKGASPNNIYHDLAFLALNALLGNLRPGGMLSLVPEIPLASLPATKLDNIAREGLARPRLDQARTGNAPLPGNALHAFLDAINNDPPYAIELLLVHEANPAYSLSENKLFTEAAAKIDLMVSFSSYMDETARLANLILPNHMALERYDDIYGLAGTPYSYYAVAAPIITPQFETRHTGEVVCELSRMLGGNLAVSLPWTKYDAYLQERVKGLAASGKGAIAERAGVQPWRLKAGGLTPYKYPEVTEAGEVTREEAQELLSIPKDKQDIWKKLIKGVCWYDAPVDVLEILATQSGRYEFACQLLLTNGMALTEDRLLLPHYNPLVPSGDDKTYPLLLIPYRMLYLSDQYLANPPFMTKTLFDDLLKGNELLVQIHPETAKAAGLKEADRAMLKTPQGEVSVRVHIFQGAAPGAVFIAQGLGHTAYDEYIQDKGVNANNVIEVQMDPVTGLGTVWATRAQLRPA